MSAPAARWYTKTRRFPTVYGRLSSGEVLWGGPYTGLQVGVGAATIVLLVMTMSLWAVHGLLVNVALFAMIAAGAIWGAGQISTAGRNPFVVMGAASKAWSAPKLGTLNGRAVRLPRVSRPLPVGASLPGAKRKTKPAPTAPTTEEHTASPAPVAAPLPLAAAPPPPRQPQAAPPPVLTAVQALMAGATK